jgi:type IV pilus biogenesis protein CpaD/CtpE
MTTPTSRDRALRRLRAGALALASALALAACEAQPVGSFQNAKFVADGSRALQSVFFQPGSPALRPGEAQRIRSFLSGQLITPQTDILLHVGRTGSPLLDARRRGTLRASMPRTPARVRLIGVDTSLGADLRIDSAQLEVVQYNRLVVKCPGNPAADYELTTPLPNQGCSNAVNLANMAESVRDLTDPRDFSGSDGVTAGAAVERYQDDKVKVIPLEAIVDN